jgi:hypothetical protein
MTAAWSALVTGVGGALALALFWVDAKVPGRSRVPVPVRAVEDRGAGTGAARS